MGQQMGVAPYEEYSVSTSSPNNSVPTPLTTVSSETDGSTMTMVQTMDHDYHSFAEHQRKTSRASTIRSSSSPQPPGEGIHEALNPGVEQDSAVNSPLKRRMSLIVSLPPSNNSPTTTTSNSTTAPLSSSSSSTYSPSQPPPPPPPSSHHGGSLFRSQSQPQPHHTHIHTHTNPHHHPPQQQQQHHAQSSSPPLPRPVMPIMPKKPTDLVYLCVGGQKFVTTISTLNSSGNSYFSPMFSGRFSTSLTKDNEIFIDRDPQCFGIILNYLRTGKLFIPSDIPEHLLHEEAQFYCIDLPRMRKKKEQPPPKEKPRTLILTYVAKSDAEKTLDLFGKLSENMQRQFEWSKAAADWKSWVEILIEDGWELQSSTHAFDKENTEHRTFIFHKLVLPTPTPPPTNT